MNPTLRLQHLAALFTTIALLSACGDGDDPPAAPPPAAPSAVLEGTAAVGAALGHASVSITDTTGAAVCTNATITTSGAGDYSCTLQPGKTAPFLIVVTDPSGAQAPLVSIGSSTPAAGASLTLNATPLTTAIVGQLAPGGDALSVVATPSLIDTTTLASINTRVLTQLASVLTALDAPAGYDPFTTPIVAATASVSGNTADQVIDLLRVSVVNGVTTISTVDNPAAAVPLAGPGSSTPPALPAPSATVVTLAEAMRLLTPALNGCFALAVGTRVVTRDDSIPAAQGGPEVTAVAPACGDITHPDYLHNGYSAGQSFYGLLNDAAMVGASFRPPELLRFIDDTTPADQDRAVINVRYVDSNGVAGNMITVAQKFPGSATADHATDWWLYGNQQLVDTAVRAFLRRNEQLAPNPGVAPFANASASRFESGFDVFINKNGPGSTGLRAARVTGPGLPNAGLVLTPPDPSIITSQNWLNILSKDGNTDPMVAVPAPDVGNIFRVQRTLGLTGSDATTVRANPNAGNTNSTAFTTWAHPLDYGQPPGSTGYIDFAALPANTLYQVELFYTGETAARHTFTKTLLTPVVPATRAANLQWVTLATGALQYLDPAHALSAATATINLSWLANPYAESIRSAGVYTFGGGLHVDQGLVGVTRGATSAVATAPGTGATPFPLLTNDGSSTRLIQLRYRMLDGSYKDSFTRYN
jgi:hypothetical protein